MKKSSHHRRRRPVPPAADGRSAAEGHPGPDDDGADRVDAHAVDLAIAEEELGDNALADATLALIDRLRPYFGTILLGLGAAVAAFIGYAVVASQAEATRTQAWDACLAAMSSGEGEAFNEVVRRYPGTPAARWAELLMADAAAAEGTQLLFIDRQRAEGRLQAAIDLYGSLLAAKPQGVLAERAVFGLAKARESIGQLADARRGYEVVAAEYPADGLTQLAAGRAADLGRESTRQWYDWFAAQKLTAPAALSTDAATPASTPSGSQPGSQPAREAGSDPGDQPGREPAAATGADAGAAAAPAAGQP